MAPGSFAENTPEFALVMHSGHASELQTPVTPVVYSSGMPKSKRKSKLNTLPSHRSGTVSTVPSNTGSTSSTQFAVSEHWPSLTAYMMATSP